MTDPAIKFMRFLEARGYVIIDTRTRYSVEDEELLKEYFEYDKPQYEPADYQGAGWGQMNTNPGDYG